MYFIRLISLVTAVSFPAIAVAASMQVRFEAELDDPVIVAAVPQTVRGSFTFDNAEVLDGVSDIVGRYFQRDLSGFLLDTPRRILEIDSGQIIRTGFLRSGINIYRPPHVYAVQVGLVSYPQFVEDQEFIVNGIPAIDYGDLHFFNIDVPLVVEPIATMRFVYEQEVEAPLVPSVSPPSLHELQEAEI